MTLFEWFDPWDIRHREAYQHLRKKGFWPEGFIPKNILLSSISVIQVQAKLADALVDALADATERGFL